MKNSINRKSNSTDNSQVNKRNFVEGVIVYEADGIVCQLPANINRSSEMNAT